MDEKELDYVKIVGDFASTISGIEARWSYLYEEIGKLDRKQGDLLHEIENGKYDVFRGFNKFTELQALRVQRRILKNEQRLIEPLYKFFQGNRKLQIDLHKTKTEMTRIHEENINWEYHPRSKEEEQAG